MKNKLFIFLFTATLLCCGASALFSQVAINNDGSAADGSAMLNVKSGCLWTFNPSLNDCTAFGYS